MDPVSIASISIIGLFILFILNKRQKKIYDYSLLVMNLILAFLIYTNSQLNHNLTPTIFFFNNALPLWLISAFLLFAIQLLFGAWHIRFWWIYVFAIPFTVYLVLDIWWLSAPFEAVIQQKFTDPNWLYHFFFKGHISFSILAGIWILRVLKRRRENLKENYSAIDHIDLNWLRHFTYFLIAVYSVSLVFFLLYNVDVIQNIDFVYIIISVVVYIGTLYVSYHGIKQYNAESPRGLGKAHGLSEGDAITEPAIKYRKSSLNEQGAKSLFEALDEMVDEEQLFSQAQLKVADLAARLDVHPNNLSQAINTVYGKPFYDYIAQKRVALLQEKLKVPDNKQYTILSLAYECGFNSKASLHRHFKQQTGQTPSQFQKSHLPG